MVIAALGVAFLKNLFHSVLALAAVLILTAVVFLTLQAEFVAAVQILLYTGGVITLVVFAIMLTEKLISESLTQTNRNIAIGLVISLALTIFLVYAIKQEKFLNWGGRFSFDTTKEIASGFLSGRQEGHAADNSEDETEPGKERRPRKSLAASICRTCSRMNAAFLWRSFAKTSSSSLACPGTSFS